MKRNYRFSFTLMATALVSFSLMNAAQTRQKTEPPTSFQQRGRTYTNWFYTGALERLWERFSPKLRQHFGGVADLRAFRQKIEAQAGSETALLEDRVLPWLGETAIYNRTARFSKAAEPVWVQWTVDSAGVVHGFLVKPAPAPAPSRFLDYQTKTPLRLPFAGAWFVYWGGRTVLENYHAAAKDQRFAYDFVIARAGRTHAGDASKNASYYCFGQPVLAPSGGTVVKVADGSADNAPGQMNEKQPLGNHVILNHGNGEYSFLAHLQNGSVKPQSGQTVNAGDVIGRCGNSGRSSEPHLHYHLQNGPEFGAGEGLPAQFLSYQAHGQTVARGEPARGQTVAPR